MPRKLKNPAVIEAHVAKVHGCELKPFLHCCTQFGPTEVHHPLCGNANRIDAPWNLVSICQRAHRWCEANKTAGLVLCWDRIADRGDMDWQALEAFWRQSPRARIEMVANDDGSRWRMTAKALLWRWFDAP